MVRDDLRMEVLSYIRTFCIVMFSVFVLLLSLSSLSLSLSLSLLNLWLFLALFSCYVTCAVGDSLAVSHVVGG